MCTAIQLPPQRIQQIAQELWGHLNLCLTGAARTIFDNIPSQEGLEAWRRLMKPRAHGDEQRVVVDKEEQVRPYSDTTMSRDEKKDDHDSPESMIAALFHSEANINAMDEQATLPFEVVLDSGAVDHVADSAEAPGYAVSREGKSVMSFTAANGDPIENRGVMILNLTTTEGFPIQSKFQVCNVSRPLWSVGKICDVGCTVTFDNRGAHVKHNATGKNLCLFERRGGLYVARLPLSRPKDVCSVSTSTCGRGQGFTRQD